MGTETKTIAEQFPWAVEGADAYSYQADGWGYRSLRAVKITKVTKARITLEGGRQFYVPKYRDSLTEVGTDVYRSPELIATDDPRVEETRRQLEQKKIEGKARDAAKHFTNYRDVENARKAIAALMDYIEANEEKEQES